MMKNHYLINYCLLFFVLGSTFFSCKTYMEKAITQTRHSYQIRVKLSIELPLVIEMHEDLMLIDMITQKKISLFKNEPRLTIEQQENQLTINGKIIQTPIKLISASQDFIRLNDRYYPGYIKLYPDTMPLQMVNYIPIETYLISVLPSEVPLSFHDEALKAQVIAARTYAYYFIRKHAYSRNYDVDDTTAYQVYKGFNLFLKNRQIKKIIKLIKETESKVITFQDQPILAFFHANSGGRLRSSQDYFGRSLALAYLVNKEDPYSLGFKGDKWQYQINFDQLKEKLQLNRIDQIIYHSNGFVKSLGSREKNYTSRQLRKILGYTRLRSDRFKLEIKDEQLLFQGIGYGHGVGMSQWGAQAMALKGFKTKEIINFYYPGTSLDYF